MLLYLIRALMILSVVMISTEVRAQDICVSTPEGRKESMRLLREIQFQQKNGPVPFVQESTPRSVAPNGSFFDQPKTPWGTTIPHLFGQYGQRQQPQDQNELPDPPETRFSWYGFRHAELHQRGVIAELVKKVGENVCCSGVWKGECRVTKLISNGVGPKMVMIDDLPCPISEKTKLVFLETFQEHDTVVLCANRTSIKNMSSPSRSCPATHCLGGGKIGG
jgi:hypothetical protein